MKNITFALSTLALVLFVSTANAADVQFKISIDGNSDAVQQVNPGTHTLLVEGMVSDNVVVGDTIGGFLQASFDLLVNNSAITWKQGENFLGQPNGKWGSTSNDAFQQHNEGIADGTSIIQETGSILTSQWDAKFGDVGAEVFSFIASGEFDYDGTDGTIVDLVSGLDVNVVATLNGSNIGGMNPTNVTGTSVTLTAIPEPATLMLAGLGLIGLIGLRRRNG